MMQKKKFGNTGLKVSVIGFGGIPIFRTSKSEATYGPLIEEYFAKQKIKIFERS